jgi:hypothetical protein
MKYTSAYKSLIHYALSEGLKVTVQWEDEVDLKLSSDFNAIVDAVEATDGPTLVFYRGEILEGRAGVIVSLDDSEQVADFTSTPFIDGWFDKFIDGEL